MTKVTRTVIVNSVKLSRKIFRIFVELEGMYHNMVEQLTMYAVKNNIKSFTRLKVLKYREMRNLYPQLPSHYVYTACQDASTRAKSFLRLKKLRLAERDYPEVRRISIWLDDHLWKSDGYTSIKIATHKGWVTIDFEPHKQYWRYVNCNWRLATEAKIKLDKRDKRLIIYLTFIKDVKEYNLKGYLPVDINENNVTIMVVGVAFLFETSIEKLVLGYYYRRRKVQERYDKLYGVKSRIKRKILKKLKEKKRKSDIRWKIVNIIVRTAYERQYAIVLEKLGKKPERIPLVREVYVAEDPVEAREKAEKYIGAMYFRDYVSWSHSLVKDLKSFEDVARDRFIVGDPDECISQVEDAAKRLGVTDMIFRVHYPGMDLKEGLEVIRLLGEKVIPYFKDLEG